MKSKGADFFQVFLLDLEANLFVEHQRSRSPWHGGIGRRSILHRRTSWSRLSLPYHWRRSSTTSSSKISSGPMQSPFTRGSIRLSSTLLLLWWRSCEGVCRIRSRSKGLLRKRSLWRGMLQQSEGGTSSWSKCACPRCAGCTEVLRHLANQLLAHSGERAKGHVGGQSRPIEVLLYWLS